MLPSLLSTDLVINTSHGSWFWPPFLCLPLSPILVLCLLLLSSLPDSHCCQAGLLCSCSLFYCPVSSRKASSCHLVFLRAIFTKQSQPYTFTMLCLTQGMRTASSSKSEWCVYSPYLHSKHSIFMAFFGPCYLFCPQGLSLLLLDLWFHVFWSILSRFHLFFCVSCMYMLPPPPVIVSGRNFVQASCNFSILLPWNAVFTLSHHWKLLLSY